MALILQVGMDEVLAMDMAGSEQACQDFKAGILTGRR